MTKSFQNRTHKAKNHANRTLQHEHLEKRELLSTVSPTATQEDITENVAAIVAPENPTETACQVEMNLETPQEIVAPLEANLNVSQDQDSPAAVTASKTTQKIVIKKATQEALKDAINQASDGAVITFAKSLRGAEFILTEDITISKKITFDASSLKTKNGANEITFCRYESKVLDTLVANFTINSTVKFIGIDFEVDAPIDSSFSFKCSRSLGLRVMGNCSLTLEDCYFEGNFYRGITCNSTSSVTLKNTTFQSLPAYVIYATTEVNINISDCVFNHCDRWLCAYRDCKCTVTDSVFEWKTNTSMGFEIYNYPTFKFSRCLFRNNQGMIAQNGDLSFYNCVFDNNIGTSSKWVFRVLEDNLMCFINCTFCDNKNTIYADDGSSVNIFSTILDSSDNLAGKGYFFKSYCICASVDSHYYPIYSSQVINKGNNFSLTKAGETTDFYGNQRIVAGTADIGAVECFQITKAVSTTSNKVQITWDSTGAASYTVMYRPTGSTKWTSKVVKGKLSLDISVKSNTEYEAKVIPLGMEDYASSFDTMLIGALSKLTVKTLSKSDDTISFKVSNFYDIAFFDLRVKTQKEKTYKSYTIYSDNSDSIGSLSYTFTEDGTLTIKGLSSNTTYNFQIAQKLSGLSVTVLNAVSPYTSVSAATTKTCYNTPTITSLSAISKGMTVNWNTVYGKGSTTAAQKYTIQYAIQGTGKWKTATSSAKGNSYTVKSLKAGTTYEFRICATKDTKFMTSLYSSVKTGTTK